MATKASPKRRGQTPAPGSIPKPKRPKPPQTVGHALPDPVPRFYTPVPLENPGWWLVLSDIHLPYHDKAAVEAAVKLGRDHKAVGVLLNGDMLDYHELSRFDHDPTAPRYREERKTGLAFLAYLRGQFPHARIVYKAGNHEERLENYVMQRAPALFGLELLTLPMLMDLENYGVEYIGDKRIIRLGKLNVIHGHEYTERAIASPVNPARGLYNKAKGTTFCGHHHQTSEHHEPTIDGRLISCWSSGCLCQLNPQYRPLNRWSSGFALVQLEADGNFHMRNLRVLNGRVL